MLLGGCYGFSNSFIGDDAYVMQSFGLALGYRYYFNTEDTIRAYISSQVAIDLAKFTRLESRTALGFLFEITPMMGIFLESNLALAGLYNSDSAIGKGVQLRLGSAAGLSLYF
jgi:hypothetical protein